MPVFPATHPGQSLAAVFARENRQAIMDKFADFQRKVCNKLFKNGVDTEEVQLFVTNQFPPGDCIPPPPASLTEVFKAISRHGLWDYFHYSPLVRITKVFGADDDEMKDWVKTYMRDLKAYSLVATLEEYIEIDVDDDIADTPSARRAKYDIRYYTPVEWKTEFIDNSLQHLTEVWELFSSHYLVPDSPPTALLDRVRQGCLSLTWLIPSGLIPLLIKKAKIDTKFFQHHHILKVTVGDECIYEEVTKENTSVSFLLLGFAFKVPKCIAHSTKGIDGCLAQTNFSFTRRESLGTRLKHLLHLHFSSLQKYTYHDSNDLIRVVM